MKRIPRLLATLLILALLNVSYINIALASTDPPAKAVPVSPVTTSARESSNVPDDDPCSPKVTKKCIENDLDTTQSDFDALKGTDPDSFSYKFFTESGFDITEDVTDAKTDLDALTDDDTDTPGFKKFHKKFKKRHQLITSILSNPSLMAMLHRPAPVKFRVVTTGASGSVVPGNEKALFVSSTTQDMNRSFPSMESTARRGAFAHGLTGLNVMVVPELDGTCQTGDGVPGGVNAVFIAKTVAFLAEAVKEAIPDDTATVLPHGIAVIAWAAAKGTEILLDGMHAVYMECKTIKDGDKVDGDLQTIKSSVSSTNSSVTTINSTVNSINTTVGGINSHTDTKVTEIKNNDDANKKTIIDEIDTKAGNTTDAVNNSTTTINNNITTNINSLNTTINNTKTELNTSITNSKTELNTNITNSKTEINKTVNDNRTLIINNANTNASNSLRLMIEADLATADSSTPLAIFETPASKGGYLELARTIVFETIRNLTGATIAQANALLASTDTLIATGKYKAAYAALRKAYKTAAN